VTFIASIEKGKANNKTILHASFIRSRIFPNFLTDLPSVLYVGRLVTPKVHNQLEKNQLEEVFLVLVMQSLNFYENISSISTFGTNGLKSV